MPDGVLDIAPEHTQLLTWSDIKTVLCHLGDIYFWTASKGIFVPRSAFSSLSETHQFYMTALEFWRNPTVNATANYTKSIALNEKLEEGEIVLWQGGSNLKISEYLFSFMPISLLIIGVLATAFTVITTGLAGIKALIGIWIGLLSFVAVLSSAYQNTAKKLQYALTDKRVLALYPKGRGECKITTVEYGQIDIIQYYYISPDVVTFKFLTATEMIVFYEISNATTASGIVARERGRQYTDFQALFMSRMNNGSFVSVLQQGESILWQGQPQSNPHTRSKNAVMRFYAVTNQRLLLLNFGKYKFFAEADLAKINNMSYDELPLGVGTFSFGGPCGNYLSFESLANPSDVRKIIDAARSKITSEAIDWAEATNARITTK